MSFISRGPSNLGGRTRAFSVDISDLTSNTMLSGGVSSVCLELRMVAQVRQK
ncbi:hypothetical protein PI23P_03272 [Polaribacter irgensii 23-P]|uniref:Uncharacterized protein n=1 Tax=Polaribacter irgensii 23-P TaxID=313594 RepID=A4BWZ1_9FLAO|nr:hypothetical protein [Polaribacter irgensii]EAR13482.1 hypothetical protein PI23P_03272 [Polaribacter irgensii 23-P]